MSLTYATLKTAIADYAHRTDAATIAAIPGFVRLAEGMMRRELSAYELTDTLEEADRSALGVYNLASTVQVVRAVYNEDGDALENVGTSEIRSIASTEDPIYYTIIGDQIEFRGVPETNAEFTVRYFGHPAELSADGDDNDLLINHEGLYIYGSLFYLYQYTQDLELGQAALDTFVDIKDKLNEMHSRRVGGARTQLASYNLGNLTRRGGY
jgi:hypothetical protein